MSKKSKRKKRIPPENAQTVVERALGMCEVMSPHSGCVGQAQQLHHRKMRSQGGWHEAVNMVHVCHKCHDYIHTHPAIAYTNGWLVKSTHDPAETPFKRRGGFVKLTEDGGFSASPEPEWIYENFGRR